MNGVFCIRIGGFYKTGRDQIAIARLLFIRARTGSAGVPIATAFVSGSGTPVLRAFSRRDRGHC